MSQPDEAPSIQEFFRWANRERKYARIDPNTDERVALNPIPPIKAYFEENKHEKLNAILAALFKPHDPPNLAEVIVQSFTVAFTILLYIGKGKFIEPFAEHNSLDDDHLPFDPSNKPISFPNSSDEDFFERFCRQQWRFCCPIFSLHRLWNEHFHEKRVLPIANQEQLGQGGSAILYKIRIHEEYNYFLPEDIKKKLRPEYANTFVLKTYVSRDAEKNHKNEVAAFQRLKNASHIIGYYGSYKHGETRHIILEYADRGDLETNFMEVNPPQNGEDILRFWKGILNLVAALIAIHAVRPQGAPNAPPVFQGLHQDVKPQNILVVSKEEKLPYGWQFKLGDLGLSQFEKLTSLRDGAAIDAQGTRTYGAPECYRADAVLAAAELPVTPAADIWSLGCIFSEAARWMATGKRGLLAYREERLSETRQISNFEDGNCFHEGQHTLKAVRDSHEATIRSLHKDDTITKRVLKRLVDEMLQSEPDTRPTARQLWPKVLKILLDAEADINSFVNEPQIRGNAVLRPPPPPVLPPGKIPNYHHPHPPPGIRQDNFGLNGAGSLLTIRSDGESFLKSDGTDEELSYSPEGWDHGEGRQVQRRHLDDLDGSISKMTPAQQKPAGSNLYNRRRRGIWRSFSGGHNTDSSAEPPISEHSEISNTPHGGRSSSFSVTGNSQRQGDFRAQNNSILASKQVSGQELGSSHLSSAPNTPHGYTTTQNTIPSRLDQDPREQKTDLDYGNENFMDCSSEIKDLPEKLKQCVSKWFNGIPAESTGSSSLDPLRAVYVLSCSKLHPISYTNLKTLIGRDRRHIGLKKLEGNEPLFEVDIRCPSCDNKHGDRAKSARQIEPLHYISAEIDKITGTSIRHKSTTLSTTLPAEEPQGEDIVLTTSSSSQFSNSSSHADSFNRSIAGPNDTVHGRKHSGDSSVKLKSDKRTRPSYSFSADGCSLLLWARDAENIIIYNIESRVSEEFPATLVHIAAGGANRYTTVSKKGSHECLRIHDVNGGVLVASVDLESSILSIALSRNDESVALGIVGKVLVYNTSNLEVVRRHELPPPPTPPSPANGDLKLKCQRVWFSADSKKVIAATMYSNGDVHIYVSNCKSPTTDYTIPHINIPPDYHKDFGLSSTLYDNKFGYAFVTAFTSKAPPTLFTLRDITKVERLYRSQLGTQIQCATSPPNPNKPEFVLVNGDNNIFSVQSLPGSPWEVKKIGRLGGTSIFVREEMMAIAMPTHNTIYTFRAEGKQRTLTTINGDKISSIDISSSLSL